MSKNNGLKLAEYPELVEQIAECVEAAYPEEGCGLVVEKPDGQLYVDCCDNLADKYHEADPENFPRTAETFYIIDPKKFIDVDKRGESIRLVFHSHVDRGDYFSDRDRQAGVIGGEPGEQSAEPAHPGADFLVVSVREQTAKKATIFSFDEQRRDFEPIYRLNCQAIEQLQIESQSNSTGTASN